MAFTTDDNEVDRIDKIRNHLSKQISPPILDKMDLKFLLQPQSSFYKNLKNDKEFKQRSFLLNEAYVDRATETLSPPTDKVILVLNHLCKCGKLLSSEKI